jgi:elongation factor Ts
MAIAASQVKELRERSGAGMMECKKALIETDGDIEVAIEYLRKNGAAKAAKKAGRLAAEGAIIASDTEDAVALVEINSETDFVANDQNFTEFGREVASIVASCGPRDTDELAAISSDSGETVEQKRTALVAKIGENIDIRRFHRLEKVGSLIECYLHGRRIGVVVSIIGGDKDLAHDIAMHIAAANPICINEEDVPSEILEKEREITTAQAEKTGKPTQIIEKMVEGKLKKYIKEVCLVGQTFVKDTELTVGKLLESRNATVVKFIRYEVGEGIDKKTGNFAEEVIAQAKAATTPS